MQGRMAFRTELLLIVISRIVSHRLYRNHTAKDWRVHELVPGCLGLTFCLLQKCTSELAGTRDQYCCRSTLGHGLSAVLLVSCTCLSSSRHFLYIQVAYINYSHN